MVAARSRLTALWFTALLLASIVPAFAPSAVAGHAIPVFEAKLTLLNPTTSIYEDYPLTGRVLRPGDEIAVAVSATVPPCEAVGLDTVDPSFVGAKATLNNLVFDSDPLIQLTQNAATKYFGNITFRVKGNFTGTAGLEGNANKFAVAVNATCPAGQPLHHAPTPKSVDTTPLVNVDTRAPRITAPAVTWVNASDHFAVAGSGVAAVNSTVTVAPLVTELNVKNVSFKAADFGWGAGPVDVATSLPAPTQVFRINESVISGKVYQGERVRFVVAAYDLYGNVAQSPTGDAWSIPVDNVRPIATAANFRVDEASLHVAPGPLGASRVAVHWTSTAGAANVDRARVQFTTNENPVATSVVATAAGTSVPIPFANPYAGTVNVTLQPIDSAGNINTVITISPPFIQPSEITVQYGGIAAQPVAVTRSGLFNVYTNVTGPQAPAGVSNVPSTAPPVYGMLVRNHTGAELRYWENGTEGKTIANHFTDDPIVDTSQAPDPDGDETNNAFQPSLSLSTAGRFVFANLSDQGSTAALNREFIGGAYQLWMNVTGAAGTRTNLTRFFAIDGELPAGVPVSGVGSNNNYTRGVGHNWTELHGMDNNPVRAYYAVHDSRVDTATGSFTDSKLRNITFEFVTMDQSEVVKRTGIADDPLTTIDERLARVDFNLTLDNPRELTGLPYLYDFRNNSAAVPADACALNTPDTTPACIWWRVRGNNNWSMSWFNQTNFSGWVNLTFPDLAAGKYKLRVLAFDNANGMLTPPPVFPGSDSDAEVYRVAPAVKIYSDHTSPLVTTRQEGGVAIDIVDVSVLASQRYLDPELDQSLNSLLVDKCAAATGSGVEDICPAQKVRIYLSNTGTGDGAFYQERDGAFASSTVVNDAGRGFTGAHLSNGSLAFSNTGVPLKLFRYDSTSEPALPSNISITQPIYVRAEAIALKNGVATIARSSEWMRAVSPNLPVLNITEPAAEWGVNLTTISGHRTPPFRVQFNTTDKYTSLPTLKYNITAWNSHHQEMQKGLLSPLLNAGNAQPEYVYNWTGLLAYVNSSGPERLANGSYQIRVDVIHPTLGTSVATQFRNFTIIDDRPVVRYNATQADTRLVAISGGYATINEFEISILADHDDVNLTGFNFGLKRNDAPTGTPTDFFSPGDGTGTGGFRVTIVSGLPLPEFNATQRDRRTEIVARVELPPGLTNNNTLILSTTALYDREPFKVGNTTKSIIVLHDKQAPAGTLLVRETESTVFLSGTGVGNTPPQNRPAGARAPSFWGFAEDLGSGVKRVEVRLVDLTTQETLQLTVDGGATPVPGTEHNIWASSDAVVASGVGVRLVDLYPTKDGQWFWHVNTTGRVNTTKNLYTAAPDQANDTGVINLSHRYRVDVRMTDNLGQTTSVIQSTEVDFDAAPPYLGYKGQLNTPNLVPSGIHLAGGKKQINWNGVGDSLVVSVNVTDNHCIAAVRLVGNSSKNPSVIVKADMAPSSWSGSPSRVCPNGAPVEYRLDLAAARDIATGNHFLDDVGNYTLWWEAEDWAAQGGVHRAHVSEIPSTPSNYRTQKIEVLDNSPAVVRSITVDPPIGQAGGRALIRANVFDNLQVHRVTLEARNASTNARLALINMTAENVTAEGNGIYRADTTDDLGLTLEVGDYVFNVTAYDTNWNRTVNPTCPVICHPRLHLLVVRDDGAPSVVLETPAAGATLGGNASLKFRALHKAIDIGQISVRATTDGNVTNLTAVPTAQLNFTELRAANGTRQGWTVTYTPTGLADNTTLIVNVSVAVASLVDAKQYTFTVDARAPTVTANVTGTQTVAGRAYAVRTTRVTLAATDTVSTPTIRYSVNGGAEQVYAGEITPGGPDGEWRLEYWATDPAGNAAAKQTLTLHIDATGPRISVAAHGDDVLLTVTDAGVGLNESTVTVHYRYGTATAFSTKRADKLAGNSFGTTLPGNATEDGLAYYFTAEDVLGNAGSNYTAAQPHTIRTDNGTPTNLPPTIRITSPVAGASVRNLAELRWLAEDPEEAPLTITIALRDPAPGRVLVAAGENSGSYPINTTGFPAGAYTVVVTANDGEHSAAAQVTFTVESGDVIQVRNVPPATVLPNTQVAVAVALNPVGKTIAQATYRLTRDGAAVTSGVLAPQQGLYAAAFTPSAPGNYTVVVEVVYTDGTSEPAKQVANFRVPGTVGSPGDPETRPTFPASLMALVAIAVLTVALAAYGAFGRWKK